MIEWPLSVPPCVCEGSRWMPVSEPVEETICRCVKGGNKESDSWYFHSFMSLAFVGFWFDVTHLADGAADSRVGMKSRCDTLLSPEKRIRREISCDCVSVGGKTIYIFYLIICVVRFQTIDSCVISDITVLLSITFFLSLAWMSNSYFHIELCWSISKCYKQNKQWKNMKP